MSKPTLEQRRARDTWDKSQGCTDEYMKLAKGLPALIMNSGLMQTLAFMQEKGSKGASSPHYKVLSGHLRSWLRERFPDLPPDFPGFMDGLMSAEPRTYQDVTAEAFAWLKWMRQMAAARRES